MWSAMGLPLGRALCCIPTAESLSSWIPVHEVQVDIDTWREQALGTSMVMAHFVNHEAVARDALEQQVCVCSPPP